MAGAAGIASGQTVITFDDKATGLQHGSFFSGSEYSSQGVTFSVDSKGIYDQLAIYSTNNTGGADPDLEIPFKGGNLEGTKPGNALIIAENITDKNGDNIIDNPSDQGDGGTITVSFSSLYVDTVGFSLYDTPENARSAVSIVFRDSFGGFETWKPSDLLAFDGSAAFGNNFANNFSGITADYLGIKNIASIDFNIESGAIDSIAFSESKVPEPSSAGLLILGSAGFLLRRKR